MLAGRPRQPSRFVGRLRLAGREGEVDVEGLARGDGGRDLGGSHEAVAVLFATTLPVGIGRGRDERGIERLRERRVAARRGQGDDHVHRRDVARCDQLVAVAVDGRYAHAGEVEERAVLERDERRGRRAALAMPGRALAFMEAAALVDAQRDERGVEGDVGRGLAPDVRMSEPVDDGLLLLAGERAARRGGEASFELVGGQGEQLRSGRRLEGDAELDPAGHAVRSPQDHVVRLEGDVFGSAGERAEPVARGSVRQEAHGGRLNGFGDGAKAPLVDGARERVRRHAAGQPHPGGATLRVADMRDGEGRRAAAPRRADLAALEDGERPIGHIDGSRPARAIAASASSALVSRAHRPTVSKGKTTRAAAGGPSIDLYPPGAHAPTSAPANARRALFVKAVNPTPPRRRRPERTSRRWSCPPRRPLRLRTRGIAWRRPSSAGPRCRPW